MFGSFVILKSYCIYKSFFATQLALIDDISPIGAGPLVELVIVPLLQRFVTRGTVHLLIRLLLSVFPLEPVMSLHHVRVQSLFVLGGIITSFPRAIEPNTLSLTMLLPHVLVKKMFVAVALVANVTHVLLGHVVVHVNKELLGG